MKTKRPMLPRAALTTDRRTGGAHRVRRELTAREELTLRLNEMHEDNTLDAQELREMFDDFDTYGLLDSDGDDYYDHLLSKLETTHGRCDL